METTKSNGNKSFAISLIFAIFFLWCIFGCAGARKIDKSKTETNETTHTETTISDSSKTVTKSNVNTKIVDSSNTEETTITPLDSTKEMVVNGKTYFNVALKNKKTKSNKVVDKKEIIEVIAQNDIKEANSSQTSKQTKIEAKLVDRKQYDWTKTIIVVSIILVIVAWLIWFFYIRKPKKAIEEIM